MPSLVADPPLNGLRWFPGEEWLLRFSWHTPLGLPAVMMATTHRLLLFGEHDLGLEPYWRTFYDYGAIGPARSFALHADRWWVDLGRAVIRYDPGRHFWEEV